jgi:large subunit ribosomal protein L15
MAEQQLKVTLVKSLNGQLKNIVASARGLGLRRRHQTVTVRDTRENRGMIQTAAHLLRIDREVDSMRLNTIKPGAGSKRTHLRVGRGASAGQGKTCGRGVKGQRARKGGYHKTGFEGGQMPLQRRMPKVGFRSDIKRSRAEVRLHELAKVDASVVDLAALLKAGVVPPGTERAKVVLSGEIKKAVTLKGVSATKGARAAIEAVGGKIEA